MNALAPPDLADLRAEVDRIDEALVDNLVARMEVIERIAEVKARGHHAGLALRPAREAEILRRLVGRAEGRFPARALVRMWRELLCATTRAQTPFSVAVLESDAHPDLWELARDHFGTATPLVRVASTHQALRRMSDGDIRIAVLPLPNENDLWWRGLIDRLDETAFAICIRLPFLETAPRPRETTAVVVAGLPHEPSGDDLTLAAIEAEAELSRGRLRQLLDEAGLDPAWLVTVRERGAGQALHLVEIRGFLETSRVTLANALAPVRRQLLRAGPIGGYARPLVIENG